jgi:hypothetical protein
MNIDRILLIIIIIYLIFSHFKKNKNIEKFAVTDDIKSAIKEIYNTDMDAIRTLSDFAKKIQDGNNLNIPGNLTVSGTINGNHIYTKTLDIKGKHGTTHFNYNDGGTTYLRDNVEISDHLYTNRLDIKGKHGTTHFNYGNGGTTYLRDDVYVHDYLETNKFKASGKSEHGSITIDGTKIGGGTGYLSFDNDNVIRHLGYNNNSHNQRFATGTIWTNNGDGKNNHLGFAIASWVKTSRIYRDGEYSGWQWNNERNEL